MSATATQKPPSDLDAERGLLASVLVDPDILTRIGDLDTEVFYDPVNQDIFVAMLAAREAGQDVDEISVAENLKEAGRLEAVGGFPGLNQLAGTVETSAKANWFADQVRDSWKRRRLLDTSVRLAELARNGAEPEEIELLLEQTKSIRDPSKNLPPIYIGNEGLPATWEELKQQQPPALIPGMLHERSKAILGAPAKVGKTFYSLGLAHALAKGGSWLGTDLEPRKVLVADLELHEHELNSRLWHISAQGGKPDLPQNLVRMPLRRFPEHRGRVKLMSTLKAVTEQQGGFDLIILDCLYRFLDGLDENATADMSELGKWLDTLVEATQSAVLVVHHFGKGSPGQREQIDRFRGSSTLAGEFDALMTLIPHETEDHYILETTLRSFAKPPPKVLHFDFPRFKLTDEEPTPKKPGAPAKVSDDKILQGVPVGRENAVTAKDLATALGVSKRRVQERLVAMNGIETEKIGQTCYFFR